MKRLTAFTLFGLILLSVQVFSAKAPVASVQPKGDEDCETIDLSDPNAGSSKGKRAPEEATTTAAPMGSLPDRIRDAIYTSIRNLGNAVRFVPATVTEVLKNISRTTSEALRRNITVTLISEVPASSDPATTIKPNSK